MKTLPNRRKPLSAAQYIAQCEARSNRIACARLDFRDACIRTAWLILAAVVISVTAGNLIASAIQISNR